MALFVVDIIFFASVFTYIIWFIRNAVSRFTEEPVEAADNLLLKKAFFYRADWLKGSLILKGFHKLFVVGSVVCPLIVLLDTAYGGLSSADAGIQQRVIIYTGLSLMCSVFDLAFNLQSLTVAYRDAYNEVNDAILEYLALDVPKSDVLREGISKGEQRISASEG